MLEGFECLALLLSEGPRYSLTLKLKEGVSNLGEIPDKPTIVACFAEERLQLLQISGRGKTRDCLDLGLIRLDTLLIEDVAEIAELSPGELTFVKPDLEIGRVKPVEHLADDLEVFVKRWGKDQDVVQVNHRVYPVQSTEYSSHGFLEGAWSRS